jgi:hypothetical protein
VGGWNRADKPIDDFHSFARGFGAVNKDTLEKFGRTPEAVAKSLADDVFNKNIGPGKGFSLQYHVFADARTGVRQDDPIVVPNSGFKIEQEFALVNKDMVVLITTKTPFENNGTKVGVMPSKKDQDPQKLELWPLKGQLNK